MRKIKLCIWTMIAGLTLSGLTAFPLETELAWLVTHTTGVLSPWFGTIHKAIADVNQTYPYLSYGTDWLAFAHLMLAILFIGVLRDPVKNVWVIEFGMIACICIFPLALIAGHIRQVPVFWRLIDCSFGAFGIIPLIICYKKIKDESVCKG
jgi:hypothetical protein